MRRWLVSLIGPLGLALAASCADQTNPESSPPPPDATAEDGGEDAAPPPVTGDAKKGYLLEGTVIGESGPFDGQVLVGIDGRIACAEPGDACAADPKADGVARISVDVIAPGLIDAHNHILFDIFDDSDWLPTTTYTNHNDWTKANNEPRYPVMVDVKQCLEDASQGKPAWCPAKFDGSGNLRCEMEKFGEMKGLIAGTTSIVGLAGTSSPCFSSVARSIDTQYNGLDSDKMQTSALFPPSKTTADGVCKNYASGKTTAFVIHCGEGTDDKALQEFATLGTVTTTPDCLYAPQTVITHGTAFTTAEFATMGAKGMKLVWSPASNVALYGTTTNIPAALDANVLVALAPDWSMGGSANMLDEMRFAKQWSDTKWGGRLTAKDILTMTTSNAAKALAVGDQLGTIKAGYLADLFVVKGDRTNPYDAILAATPKEVRLTMVGGQLLYGDADLKTATTIPGCEDLDACGAPKFACVALASGTDKLSQTFAQIKDTLEAALVEIDAARPAGGPNFAPLTPVASCK
jgi:cytosine/adenosine deaminase-related metal-dependent hydrolase